MSFCKCSGIYEVGTSGRVVGRGGDLKLPVGAMSSPRPEIGGFGCYCRLAL